MTHGNKQLAHPASIDVAQREMDQRAAEGEDMSGSVIDPYTTAIIKAPPTLVTESGQLGFLDLKSGCFITDPTQSSCGRFEVGPVEAYGITREQATTLAKAALDRAIHKDQEAQLKKAAVSLAKAQIIRDFLAGRFDKISGPIRGFAQLQDAVDANYYGGFIDDDTSAAYHQAFGQRSPHADAESFVCVIDLAGQVQNELDVWLCNRGIDSALLRLERGSLSRHLVALAAQGLPLDLGL